MKSFNKGRIATINHGSMSVGNVELFAERGPQQAIFLLASSGWKETRQIFAGIGCYGFDDLTFEYFKKKGIAMPKENANGFWSTLHTGGKIFSEYFDGSKKVFSQEIPEGLFPWCGVKLTTLNKFKKFLRKGLELDSRHAHEADKNWFNSINWKELVRYNQGDAFLGAALNVNPQVTKVGEVEEPILIKAFAGK